RAVCGPRSLDWSATALPGDASASREGRRCDVDRGQARDEPRARPRRLRGVRAVRDAQEGRRRDPRVAGPGGQCPDRADGARLARDDPAAAHGDPRRDASGRPRGAADRAARAPARPRFAVGGARYPGEARDPAGQARTPAEERPPRAHHARPDAPCEAGGRSTKPLRPNPRRRGLGTPARAGDPAVRTRRSGPAPAARSSGNRGRSSPAPALRRTPARTSLVTDCYKGRIGLEPPSMAQPRGRTRASNRLLLGWAWP